MGTFLRYAVSTASGICSRAIWGLPSLRGEYHLWISTSSNKVLFLLMAAQLPQWSEGGKYQNRLSMRKAKTCDCIVWVKNITQKSWIRWVIGWGRRKKQNCYLTRETSEKAKWVSVDTRRQEPGLKGTVPMSMELSISAARLRDSTPAHSTFKSSTFIYKGEEKPADQSKESYPRRAKQLNFFSSVTEKWGVDVPPWRDDTKSQTTAALWSPER